MPSTGRPGRAALPTGARTVGGKRPARMPLTSVQLHLAAAVGLPREEGVEHPVRLLEVLLGGSATSPQQSIGPSGTPSNTMISHGPVVVSAGNTKYSPTPGQRLKQTAEYSGRGVIPVTYVSASARIGRSNVERSGSRSKSDDDVTLAGGDDHERAVVGVALEVVERGLVDREVAAERVEVLQPPRVLHALVDRQCRAGRDGTRTRAPSRRAAPGAGSRTESPPPAGTCRPRSRRRAHAPCRGQFANMHWLDITRPVRKSSPVRLETQRTS